MDRPQRAGHPAGLCARCLRRRLSRIQPASVHLPAHHSVHPRLAAIPARGLSMDTLRALPSVHQVLEQAGVQALIAAHGRALVLYAVQRALDEERTSGTIARTPARLARIGALIGALRRPRLRPVINATGVVLHTNLGRAPLAAAAAEAAAAIAGRYSSLAFDPRTRRGGPRQHLC